MGFERAWVESPAKVNLHLEVGPQRADGYHEIMTLVQLVDLHDDIFVERCRQSTIIIDGMPHLPVERNLMHKAVSLFQSKTRMHGGIRIWIDKRIPEGGGLGGGSGNAAALLRTLNAMTDNSLSDDELRQMAAAVGSDVPLFIGSAASLVTGRGDRVRHIEPRCGISGLLVAPHVHIETRAAFSALDEQRVGGRSFPVLGAGEVLRRYRNEPVEKWGFRNDFQQMAESLHSEIAQARRMLEGTGADFVGLTGSGACVFALFDRPRACGRAADVLRERKYAHIKLLENSPAPVLQ